MTQKYFAETPIFIVRYLSVDNKLALASSPALFTKRQNVLLTDIAKSRNRDTGVLRLSDRS